MVSLRENERRERGERERERERTLSHPVLVTTITLGWYVNHSLATSLLNGPVTSPP